jgi:hypothetical protein
MYSIRIPGELPLRTNDALREYARLEYRNEDARWLLAVVRKSKKIPRSRRAVRWLARAPRRTHAAVACKGSPRIEGADRLPA